MKPADLIGETAHIVDADDHSITIETIGGWTDEKVTGRYTIMLMGTMVVMRVETSLGFVGIPFDNR